MYAVAFGFLVSGAAWLAVSALRIARRRREADRPPTRFGITFDTVGFTVTGIPPHSTDRVRLLWAEVERVAAYKVVLPCDLTIYLQFGRTDGTGVQLDEEMAGWEPFCAALPGMLPGCRAMPGLIGKIADDSAKGVLYRQATA